MSESSIAENLLSLARTDLESGLKSVAKKAAELGFINALTAVSASVTDTVLHTENLMTALTKITVANQYAELIKTLEQQASILPDSARKVGLQLAAIQLKTELAAVQQDFIATFARTAKDFPQAVEDYLRDSGSAAGVAKKILGGAVGVWATFVLMQGKLDEALEAGQPPEQAGEIIAKTVISFAATTAAGLAEAMPAFVDRGVADLRLRFLGLGELGKIVQLGAQDRFLLALGRAGAAGMALTLAFELGYKAGELINDTWGDSIGAGVDWAAELFADLSRSGTSTRYLNEVSIIAILAGRIDPSADADDLNRILQASAQAFKDLAELTAFHNALRKILTPELAITATASPETFFTAVLGSLESLKTNHPSQTYTLRSLVADSPSALATKAEQSDAEGLAIRYALKEGNPFALVRADYSRYNTAHELDLYDPVTGQGEMTQRYIEERAQMLAYWMQYNLSDGRRTVDPAIQTISRYFEDVGRNVHFTVDRTGNTSASNTVKPMTVFGSDNDDFIWGNDDNDLLFGGLGIDRIDGGKGADYIEGNGGADALSGGEGTDLLLGGTGDDILIGGHGADTLFGGAGEDRYVVAVGDGWDTLTDSDGAGRIELGTFLVGDDAGPIEFKSPNVWQQTISGRSYWYILTDWTEGGETFRRLAIAGPDGEGVFVNRWANGQLGITLPGAPPLVDPVANTVAEETYTARVSGIPDVLYTWYVLRNGNQVITAGAEPILTERWWNAIDGVTGNNLLTGSPGNDLLLSGHGNSVLNGHGGQDFLAVLDGNSRLYAGDASDLATALAQAAAAQATGQPGSVFLTRTGDNTLVGSAGNDLMLLGTGDNVVVMGPGDNLLVTGVLGNVPNNVTTLGWSVRPVDGNPLNLDIDWGDIEVDGSGPLLVQGASGQVLIPGYEGNAAYHQFLSHPDEVRIHAPGAGDNLIHTGSGDSTLLLGNGNNRVFGSTGRTTVLGGTGIDTVVGGSGALEVNGRGGDDSLIGGSADDLLLGGGGADTVEGGAGNDHLEGDSSRTALAAQGNDVLDGGAGNDTLFGQGGDDTLLGGSGEDRAYGGEGDDTLDGGAGADVLDGGAGDDTYVFRPGDSLPNAQRVADTVYDDAGTNRLLLDFAQSADLRVSVQDGAYLLARGEDRLLVMGGETGSVARYVFRDGSSLDHRALFARYGQDARSQTDTVPGADLSGSAQGDTLVAGGGGSRLTGGRGNDLLIGSGGNNTYVYDLICIAGFNPDHAANSHPIDLDRFADAAVLNHGLDSDHLNAGVKHLPAARNYSLWRIAA